MCALIITYHAIADGPPPLCVAPDLFERHLDVLRTAGAHCLTVSELAARRAAGTLDPRAVALTFDDAFAGVAERARPALLERGMTGTVYCVAGHIGGRNDWPSQPHGSYQAALMGADQMQVMAAEGFEIGAHGMYHAPLHDCAGPPVETEVRRPRAVLEEIAGTPVATFAYPYGVRPSPEARAAVEQTYAAAVGTELRRVGARSDAYHLPRIDAHYLRDPRVLRAVAEGRLGAYVAARRGAARIRRLARADHAR